LEDLVDFVEGADEQQRGAGEAPTAPSSLERVSALFFRSVQPTEQTLPSCHHPRDGAAAAGLAGGARRGDPPPLPARRTGVPLPRLPRLQAMVPPHLRPRLPPQVPQVPPLAPSAGIPLRRPRQRHRNSPIRAHVRLLLAASRPPPVPRNRCTPRPCAPAMPWESLGECPRGVGPHLGRAQGTAHAHSAVAQVPLGLERGGSLCGGLPIVDPSSSSLWTPTPFVICPSLPTHLILALGVIESSLINPFPLSVSVWCPVRTWAMHSTLG
jgi:hypothetical protein